MAFIRSHQFESIERRLLLAVAPTAAQVVAVNDAGAITLITFDAETALNFGIPHAHSPALSPDRTRIVFAADDDPMVDSGSQIYTVAVDGTGLQKLTNGASVNQQPRFSPDGSKIVFVSNPDGDEEIYEMNADGSSPTRLTQSAGVDENPSYSPDGTHILFDSNRGGNYDIYTTDDGPGAPATPLASDAADDTQPTFSADGSHIAFISKRGGFADLWRMNADGSSPVQLGQFGSADQQVAHPSFNLDGQRIATEIIRFGNSHIEMLSADDGFDYGTLGAAGDSAPSWSSAPAFGGIANHILKITGTSAADTITVSETADLITATLDGKTETFNPDGIISIQVFCGEGNDTLLGDQSTPAIYVSGGAGSDLLIGGPGNDTLTGGAGKNTLHGGQGNDRLNGSNGRDFVYGEEGSDRLYGSGGNDYLVGGAGVDRIWGGDGADLIIGNSGNDKLFGEAGNDTVLAGDGNDHLEGGLGIDVLNGGKGKDNADDDNADTRIAIETLN